MASSPVFTIASTNDPLPWPDRLGDKKAGQINAFFRSAFRPNRSWHQIVLCG